MNNPILPAVLAAPLAGISVGLGRAYVKEVMKTGKATENPGRSTEFVRGHEDGHPQHAGAPAAPSIRDHLLGGVPNFGAKHRGEPVPWRYGE